MLMQSENNSRHFIKLVIPQTVSLKEIQCEVICQGRNH